MEGFDAVRLVIRQLNFLHEGGRNAIAVVGVTLINEASHLRKGVKTSRADEDMDLCQAGLQFQPSFGF